MHQMRHKELDERINDFLARKTAPKNLSQIIADHLTTDKPVHQPKRTSSYELLPIRHQISKSH